MSETVSDARMLENIFIEELKPEIQAIIDKHGARDLNPGRPSKMSAAVIEGILRSIARGVPKARATLAAGVSVRSWNTWQDDYPELEELFDRAKAFAVDQLASEIREGVDIKGNPDWKARAWLLERIDKEHFTAPKADTIVNVNNNSLTIVANPQAQNGVQSLHEQAMQALIAQKNGQPLIQEKVVFAHLSPVSLAHENAEPVADSASNLAS